MVEQPKNRMNINLLLVGNKNSGKKQLMRKMLKSTDRKPVTTGYDLQTVQTIKYKSEDNVDCRIRLHDMSGYERFRQLTSNYYKDANGVFVVFNISSEQTFIEAQERINSVKNHSLDVPIVLVGTIFEQDVVDSEDESPKEPVRVVTEEEARQFAQE